MNIKSRSAALSVASVSALLLAISLHYCANHHIVTATAPNIAYGQAELNPKWDTLLRSDILMTLGGVKPISTSGNLETYKIVVKAVGDNRIKNSDIEFFRVKDNIAIANRNALKRLVKDKTAQAIFKKYSWDFPHSADEWIDIYKRAIAENQQRQNLFKYHITLGVSHGYPPLEAEAFALDYKSFMRRLFSDYSENAALLRLLAQEHIPVPNNDEKWERLISEAVQAEKPLPWQQILLDIQNNRKFAPRKSVGLKIAGFDFSLYARLTDKELERDGYYTQSQSRLAENYSQLIRKGHTPFEIINNPQWLSKDLPPFPKNLLK